MVYSQMATENHPHATIRSPGCPPVVTIDQHTRTQQAPLQYSIATLLNLIRQAHPARCQTFQSMTVAQVTCCHPSGPDKVSGSDKPGSMTKCLDHKYLQSQLRCTAVAPFGVHLPPCCAACCQACLFRLHESALFSNIEDCQNEA